MGSDERQSVRVGVPAFLGIRAGAFDGASGLVNRAGGPGAAATSGLARSDGINEVTATPRRRWILSGLVFQVFLALAGIGLGAGGLVMSGTKLPVEFLACVIGPLVLYFRSFARVLELPVRVGISLIAVIGFLDRSEHGRFGNACWPVGRVRDCHPRPRLPSGHLFVRCNRKRFQEVGQSRGPVTIRDPS